MFVIFDLWKLSSSNVINIFIYYISFLKDEILRNVNYNELWMLQKL